MSTSNVFTILGSSGFIGSNFVEYLKNSTNLEVHTPRIDDVLSSNRDWGRIVYAIGLTADFRTRPFDTVEAHASLISRLLEKAKFDHLIYLSSTRLYSSSVDTKETAELVVNPSSQSDLYNISKILGESICLNSKRSVGVARLSNVVGFRKDSDLFIDQLIDEGKKMGTIHLKTSLESAKDYIHILDVLHLLYLMSQKKSTGIYNLASGENTHNAEILDLIHRCLGYEYTVEPNAPTWSFHKISTDKIKKEFNYKPKVFSKFFEEHLKNYTSRK